MYLFLEHGHPDDTITINSSSSSSETSDGQQEEFSDVEPDDDDDNVISINSSSSSDEDGLQLIGVYYLHIPPCKRLSGYSSTCRYVLLL